MSYKYLNAFCYTIDEDIVVERDYVKIKKVQLEDIVVERDYVKIKKVQLEDIVVERDYVKISN